MIGEEIRRRRREKGLTVAQLAKNAGMAQSAVSQIETGKRSPHSASVIKLAAALECEVAQLYPKAPSQPSLEWLSDEEIPTSRLEDLPEEARAQLEKRGFSDLYFVPLEEGEEEEAVTIRINWVRLMDDHDRLLQKVRELERQNADLTERLAKARR